MDVKKVSETLIVHVCQSFIGNFHDYLDRNLTCKVGTAHSWSDFCMTLENGFSKCSLFV